MKIIATNGYIVDCRFTMCGGEEELRPFIGRRVCDTHPTTQGAYNPYKTRVDETLVWEEEQLARKGGKDGV